MITSSLTATPSAPPAISSTVSATAAPVTGQVMRPDLVHLAVSDQNTPSDLRTNNTWLDRCSRTCVNSTDRS